ncbi:alpha/beta hydrolase [Litoreibacter albidus]|uniref:alpha/beta hydrolase n=1 Tax=Litoreibacter albidus TaxID=670155 RepID=UPI0037369C01
MPRIEPQKHTPYDSEKTVIYAAPGDPRFSYSLFVPRGYSEMPEPTQIIVAVHGTGREGVVEFRDALAEFAQWNNCIIVAPLFPVGVRGDGNRDGYKYLLEGDIRYDQVLLDIVDKVRAQYGITERKFAMFGYSGGGHFTHRFFLLHPERLWAASIGAPGSVTCIDPTRDWWVGTRDVVEKFGIALKPEALKEVPIHMVVGDADLETWEITHSPSSPHYMEGANDAGKTRHERLRTLKKSFEAADVDVTLDVLPGVSHRRLECLVASKFFFHRILKKMRASNRQ